MKFKCFVDSKGYSARSISNLLCCPPSRNLNNTTQSDIIFDIIKTDCEDALAFVLYSMPEGRNLEKKDEFLYSIHLRGFLEMRLNAAEDKNENKYLTQDIGRWQLTNESRFENLFFSGDEVNRWLTVNIEQYKFVFPLLQDIFMNERRVIELAETLAKEKEIARQTEIVRLQVRDEYEAAKLNPAPGKPKPVLVGSVSGSEVAKPENVSNTTTPKRRNSLTPVIEKAQSLCRNPNDTAEVWAELQVLAEKKSAPLIGATEDGLQYLNNGAAKIFTREALRKRLTVNRR